MILRSVLRFVKEILYKVVGVYGELLFIRIYFINKVNILSFYCFFIDVFENVFLFKIN